jgi:hypothetical protein
MDDVVVERLPDISLMGVNEERALRDEIERTLAISEYAQGMPKSSDEPLGKVAMLIGQSNLRLSSFAQNLSETLSNLANMLIEMNQEFIEEDKLYRVIGDEVSFKEFTMADKEVKVDAVVTVDPVVPPDQQTRLNQSLLLYDKFVAQDKPDPNSPDEVKQWKKRKRAIQEMILEEMGKEAYIQAFEATHVFGDREILVEKVWAKDDLDKRYRELFKKWHTVLSTTESNEIKLQHILYEYIAILRDDPGLPASLVGRKWIAFEAFDIFKEVKTILLK